jgi:CHAD domain-containing protein
VCSSDLLADASTLHSARVALKKFRYMAEVLKPVLGPGCADELELLHRCQAKQGAIHDLDLLLARLATERTPAGEKPRTTYRALSRQRSALWRSYRALAGRCFRDEAAVARMKKALAHLGATAPALRK